MCGKFTSLASWAGVTDLSQLPTAAERAGTDAQIALRVMGLLPVIVWDPRQARRRVVAMRWGFPDARDPRRPQPIHARAETIDSTKAFAQAFANAQRGIVLARSFHEAAESGAQHVLTPESPIGIAMLWRRFNVGDSPLPAAVMVTVPANRLLLGLPTDRMPAILEPEDWPVWLGETGASPAEAKACLKTKEGTRWTMRPQERPRRRPTVSDPGGLF
jgi:putative SOS response-associated peptidase YedK